MADPGAGQELCLHGSQGATAQDQHAGRSELVLAVRSKLGKDSLAGVVVGHGALAFESGVLWGHEAGVER